MGHGYAATEDHVYAPSTSQKYNAGNHEYQALEASYAQV